MAYSHKRNAAEVGRLELIVINNFKETIMIFNENELDGLTARIRVLTGEDDWEPPRTLVVPNALRVGKGEFDFTKEMVITEVSYYEKLTLFNEVANRIFGPLRQPNPKENGGIAIKRQRSVTFKPGYMLGELRKDHAIMLSNIFKDLGFHVEAPSDYL